MWVIPSRTFHFGRTSCANSGLHLLQVNDVNFENMSNDDAVRVLREMVHKPG